VDDEAARRVIPQILNGEIVHGAAIRLEFDRGHPRLTDTTIVQNGHQHARLEMTGGHELERLTRRQPCAADDFEIADVSEIVRELHPGVVILARCFDPPRATLAGARSHHPADRIAQRLIGRDELNPMLVPPVWPRITEHREMDDLARDALPGHGAGATVRMIGEDSKVGHELLRAQLGFDVPEESIDVRLCHRHSPPADVKHHRRQAVLSSEVGLQIIRLGARVAGRQNPQAVADPHAAFR